MSLVVAPAKLTLSLAVTGVRPDGYHELRAEMVALSRGPARTWWSRRSWPVAAGRPSI